MGGVFMLELHLFRIVGTVPAHTWKGVPSTKQLLAGLIILSIHPTVTRGQEDVHRQLSQAILLEQEGQYDKAGRILRWMVQSGAAGNGQAGSAWTLLGVAYEQKGQYLQARRAFEQALQILKCDPQHLPEYGNALQLFAGFLYLTEDPELAVKTLTRALRIHQQLEDHRGMAGDYANLAAFEINRKQLRSARTSLQHAMSEAHLTSELSDDDAAFLSNTHGWLAKLDGDPKTELDECRHNLELLKRSRGGDAPSTGWAYLFVGDAYVDN